MYLCIYLLSSYSYVKLYYPISVSCFNLNLLSRGRLPFFFFSFSWLFSDLTAAPGDWAYLIQSFSGKAREGQTIVTTAWYGAGGWFRSITITGGHVEIVALDCGAWQKQSINRIDSDFDFLHTYEHKIMIHFMWRQVVVTMDCLSVLETCSFPKVKG